MRLLIVEDEPACARLLSRLLERLGSIDIAVSVHEALSRASSATYDLFLVDIQLSGKANGIDLVRALRQEPRYANVPVVACSAFVHPDDGPNLKKHGFNNFVAKPFSINELVGAVADQLPCY